MSTAAWRTAVDVAAAVALFWVVWTARDRRGRVTTLAVAVAWCLGSAVPELVVLHRGVLVVMLLAVGRRAPAPRAGAVAALALVGVVMSLPGLLPVLAAAIFAAVGLVLQTTPGPRAAAAAAGAWLLAGAEALVAAAQLLEPPWASLAALVYTAAVPVACWWAVCRTSRVPWGWDAESTDVLVAQDPFAAVTVVLRGALHDRRLVVGPAGGSDRVTPDEPGRMIVNVRGRTWAVVAASPGVLIDPVTAAAVRESVEQVGEHAVLQETLRAQARELTASRGRLLDAADHERELLGPLVERVVLHPLDDVAEQLRDWPDLRAELRAATADVQAIMHGYPPVPLGRGRLVPVLSGLGSRLPVTVDRRLDPDVRASAAVETVLYAVAAEAVTNAVKHAQAGLIRLHLERRGECVAVRIADDGVGGARPDGGGLQALRLRVEARGGHLAVDAGDPCGTVVEATLPLGPDAGAP